MNFYPYRDFDIMSPLSPREIESRLQALVTSYYVRPPEIRYPAYEGIVTIEQFDLKTRTVGRRSPLLHIKGYVLTHEKGSRITVKVNPSISGMITVLFVLVFECMLIYTLFNDGLNSSFYWVPLMFGVLGYFLLVVFIKYETGMYRRVLLKVLNGTLASRIA
ncbi:hypothetical protein [Mucilaginibacter sp.]|uniref:hypothetical protein n=1 Tax=Mucilaginibacter sp. TaxID=1882438 RepID=UPI002ED6B3D5